MSYKAERYTLAQDEEVTLEVEINPAGSAFIHFVVGDVEWNISKYREWKSIWKNEVLPIFKEKGYTEVWTCVALCDVKVNKFQVMFGFKPTIVLGDCVIYRQEI